MWRSSGTNRLREWDFYIIVASWVESLSPGNEQDYWGSQAADTPGSRNLIGIKNKAVDRLIDHVLFAANREELITATLPSIAYCCGTTMWFHNGVTAKSERRAGTDTDIVSVVMSSSCRGCARASILETPTHARTFTPLSGAMQEGSPAGVTLFRPVARDQV